MLRQPRKFSRPSTPTGFDSWEEVLNKASSKDDQAFRALIEEYTGRFFMVGKRFQFSDQLIEDTIQEIFILILTKSQTYDRRRGTVHSWIMSIGYHKFIDVYRQENHLRKTLSRIPTDEHDNPIVDSLTVEDQAYLELNIETDMEKIDKIEDDCKSFARSQLTESERQEIARGRGSRTNPRNAWKKANEKLVAIYETCRDEAIRREWGDQGQ
jgi:DNA-directed RNA polymerase specialized sigma24 family protein